LGLSYDVFLEDGRIVKVRAESEATAKRQANHHEMTRVVIAGRRGVPAKPASMAVSVVCYPKR
jgi:hypothetical protein